MTAKVSAWGWRLGIAGSASGTGGRYGSDLRGWSVVGPGSPRVASWNSALLARCRELRPGWYVNRVLVRYAEGRVRVRVDGRARETGREDGVACLAGGERVARLRARLQGRPVDLELVDLSGGEKSEEAGWEGDLARAWEIARRWPAAGRLATVRAAARVEAGDRRVLRYLTKLREGTSQDFVGGYRIEVRGRLRGADRADKWVYEQGRLGRSSLSAGVSEGREEVVLKHGTLGIKVRRCWFLRNKRWTC